MSRYPCSLPSSGAVDAKQHRIDRIVCSDDNGEVASVHFFFAPVSS